MSDLSAQISNILSDPETMERIKNLSGLFGQSAAPSADPPEQTNIPEIAGAAEALPTLMKFMPLINSLKEDDDTIRLLYAIKPFLSPGRQERLEQAIKIIRIIRIVPLLKEQGLLNLF